MLCHPATANTHNLQSLHTILSTGSPLKPQSYDYVYRSIKSNVLLGSISGERAWWGAGVGEGRARPSVRLL